MIQRIESQLIDNPEFNADIKHYLINKVHLDLYENQLNQCNLIVTIGTEALQNILSRDIQAPILSILTREYTYKALLNKYHHSLDDSKPPLFAIYIDQPLNRQIDLLNLIFQHQPGTKMGILLSHESQLDLENIQKISHQHHIQPIIVHVNEFDRLVSKLNQLLKNVDVILAIPDPKIYHARSVRGILLTAFHQHIPIVGYSQSFVNNGALACVYSNEKQISAQTSQTIITLLNQGLKAVPKEQYPEH